jgi:AcrR family transcriptional regulator
MGIREAVRPGGRSSRVQSAVHAAVRALGSDGAGGELSIPAIAAHAGVTPSTIYRRWGDLTELLADVAVERLRPDVEPANTGTFAGDLFAWTEQYAEEMSSGPGRAMIRDVLASSDSERNACRCCAYTAAQIDHLLERAKGRGESLPSTDQVLDRVVAPVMYRILFGNQPISADYCRALVEDVAGPS